MTMKRRKWWTGRSNMEDIIYFFLPTMRGLNSGLFSPAQKPRKGWAGGFALPPLLFKQRTRPKVNITANLCWDPIRLQLCPVYLHATQRGCFQTLCVCKCLLLVSVKTLMRECNSPKFCTHQFSWSFASACAHLKVCPWTSVLLLFLCSFSSMFVPVNLKTRATCKCPS